MGTLGPEPTLVRVHSENLLSDLRERAESDQRLSRYGTSATTVFLRKSNAPFTSNAV